MAAKINECNKFWVECFRLQVLPKSSGNYVCGFISATHLNSKQCIFNYWFINKRFTIKSADTDQGTFVFHAVENGTALQLCSTLFIVHNQTVIT